MSYFKLLLIVLFFYFFFFQTRIVSAALFINEFSSDAESNPDWVEIYNSGDETIDLSLYCLRDNSLTNRLDLSETIAPNSYKFFDWSNKLNKTGDLIKLLLISNQENIIDKIEYGDLGEDIPAP
ncbi:MAG: lamin tail domain-containing protein [Candidatus Levyibacteriota bacterium]